MTAFAAASSSLRTLANSSPGDSDNTETDRSAFTDEEALHFAMERLYRGGLRQPPFKVCFSPSGLTIQRNRIAKNVNLDLTTGIDMWTNSGQGR
jgi:hypothetical protein